MAAPFAKNSDMTVFRLPLIQQLPGGDSGPEPGQPTEEQIAAMSRLKAMMAAKGDNAAAERSGPPPTPGHRI